MGNGSYYIILRRKFTESMLARYHRWVFEKNKSKCVETLREVVIQETEFHIIAHKTVRGLTTEAEGVGTKRESQAKVRVFFGMNTNVERIDGRKGLPHNAAVKRRVCQLCGLYHGIWSCEDFKKMDISQRWDFAKQCKLCYCCLGAYHQGQTCSRCRICALKVGNAPIIGYCTKSADKLLDISLGVKLQYTSLFVRKMRPLVALQIRQH